MSWVLSYDPRISPLNCPAKGVPQSGSWESGPCSGSAEFKDTQQTGIQAWESCHCNYLWTSVGLVSRCWDAVAGKPIIPWPWVLAATAKNKRRWCQHLYFPNLALCTELVQSISHPQPAAREYEKCAIVFNTNNHYFLSIVKAKQRMQWQHITE